MPREATPENPGTRTPLSRPALLALAATLALLLAHAWEYRFLTDDAYISFRYARNLADGHGLVFNPGLPPVEGYSNFLWVLLLAGLDRLGIAPERSAVPLGLALTAALWGVVVAAAWRRRRSLGHDLWLAVPPLLLAASRSVAVWATGGLETRLFELLATWGALRVADETEALRAGRPAGHPWGAWLLGLAGLTRPDGVLVGLMALAAGAWLAPAIGWGRRLARVAPWAVLVAGHHLFRYATYGAWVPNTYHAKVGGRLEWAAGLEYVAAFLIEYAGFVWLPLVYVGASRAWRKGGRALVAVAGAAVLPHLLYVIAIGGDHFEYRPLGLIFPFAALFAAEGLAGLLAPPRRAWAAVACVLALAAATVLLPWRTHAGFPEKYLPGFPGSPVAVGPEARRFLDAGADPVIRLPVIRSWAEAHRAMLARLTGRFAGVRQEEHRLFLEMMDEEARAIRALVGGGVLPADLHIATDCVGILPYKTGLRTLDRIGLTDAQVARQEFESEMVAHGKHATRAYGRSAGVDLWFDDPARLTVPLASDRFIRAWVQADTDRRDVIAFEGEDGLWLLAEAPQGLDAIRARLPRLRAWPLTDQVSRQALRPRMVAAWRERLGASPDDGMAYDTLGYLLLEEGRLDEAVEAYRALSRLRPDDEAARANLAIAERKAAERRNRTAP